ncbi:hypothetical protein A2U01_0028604, partial [Trifolium medium]|nr:hypothetical protein [Trifolium medium]
LEARKLKIDRVIQGLEAEVAEEGGMDGDGDGDAAADEHICLSVHAVKTDALASGICSSTYDMHVLRGSEAYA